MADFSSKEARPMPENLLTASEVAQYLKVQIETVYNLIRKAGLPAAKIGGQWRFREAELAQWVEAQRSSGPQSLSESTEPRRPCAPDRRPEEITQ
jgi:excisionase family DNA binding protein